MCLVRITQRAFLRNLVLLWGGGGSLVAGSRAEAAPLLPEIRLSGQNLVPACVTPERLMAFLERRNGGLTARFKPIASWYRYHGEAWRVRWDYAFFQMAVETNFLTYRRPDGRMGDVDPRQNNFAGIGTTGGGVPGDSFPDVKTGVLGQIQHLVAYSGELIAQPVAQRTALKQEHILAKSRELNRPVRFSDLARRWAADPKYGAAIEWVAQSYRNEFCRGEAGARSPGYQEKPHPAQPASRPEAQEILPWANQPLRPRADGASGFATGSIAVAEAPPGASTPRAVKAASPVRTVWQRGANGKSKTLDEVLAQTVVGASEGDRVAPSAQAAKPRGPVAAPGSVQTEAAAEASVTSRVQAFAEPDAVVASEGLAFYRPPHLLATNVATTSQAKVETHVLAVKETTKARSSNVEQSAPVPPVEAVTAEARGLQGSAHVSSSTFDPARTPPLGLGMRPSETCRVETASFGGEQTVLVRVPHSGDAGVRYIAVSVLDGFEKTMTESFIATHAHGGEAIGHYASRGDALSRAKELCASEG